MGINISLRHEIISDMCIPCTRFQFRYLDIRVGNSANLNLGINVVASEQPASFGI